MNHPPRSIPSAIGSTENALRALLVLALEDSAVHGYDEWVVLNILDGTHGGADAVDEIARALTTRHDAARRAVDALVGKGLVAVNADGTTLSASGRALLTELRAIVGETSRGLIQGLDEDEITTTLHVLDHLRDAATRAMANS